MNVRQKFRAIMSGKKLVLMPGCYDALSARIIEAEGFEAVVAGGYAAIGSLLAQADMGQSNMRDYAEHYGRVCAAVNVPVYVDADTGFGGVNNVRQMVRAFEDAGVAGLFLSDQVFPNRCGYLPGKQVVSTEQMLAKLKAALDARRDPELFIAARTDAAGVTSVEDAIERCQLFMEAGADMAKPMGVDTIADAKSRARTWQRSRRRPDRRRAASKTLKRPAWSRRPSRRCRCSRQRWACARRCARSRRRIR
jgi:methylisocitrate lyase